MRAPRILITCGLLAAFFYASCGGEGPTRVGRPPVVQGFSPENQALSALVGDTISFSINAFDPDEKPLERWFALADSLVSTGDHWSYVVDDTGLVTVSAVVSDHNYEARIQWTLRRTIPINYPPVIVQFSPIEPRPVMIINNRLDFAVKATDADRDSLEYWYTVDGNVAGHDDEFTFEPDREGNYLVRAVVHDGDAFATHDWNVRVTGIPDTIPPAEVPITSASTGADPGEVDVSWVAVGKDGMQGQASAYLVRTSPSPILTQEDWNRASEQPAVPPAQPSGTPMSMTITALQPAVYTHLAIRAVDDFGNLSPLGDTPGVWSRGMRVTGVVRDAVTLAPLGGVTTRFSTFRTTTAADGTFEFVELPRIPGNISVSDDATMGEIGAYYDFSTPYQIVHLDHIELFMLPNTQLTSQFYEDFYQFFRAMTDRAGIPPSHEQRRWELPIDLHVPPLVRNGLDFQRVVKEAVASVDTILGTTVFRFVDAPPEVGVRVVFRSDITFDNFGVEEWSPDWYPLKARIEMRTLYSPSSEFAMRQVVLHEIGHALGLNHSVDTAHLMIGGTAPSAATFTDDEVLLIRARYHLPRGLDVSEYGRE